jgi:Raf kinase inhibitor-like YbhB/YbcL family protein
MRLLISIMLALLWSSAVYAAGFSINSSSFQNNQRIPTLHTCDGKNISPKLSWANPPTGTVAYALAFYSPDSVVGVYYNWIIYNIPSTKSSLDEGINKDMPDDISTGVNSAGDFIYRGPCPPDTGLHHYVFELFALGEMIDLSGINDLEEVMKIINNHKLDSTKLTGLFSH